ncbi:protein phosphatase CheZ [Thiomicrorhabdus lithotrophica]|uniref:Protein phosphatase CheZ n=1 Tax=Thiomicrorhabdus lithotrophica TaxID=2949997 RepID=A0ABY8CBN8_9GAMM|nr:protein phosphatase CheZ [Thiomicrorhabdus lithotrophica]WEJ63396.1 protein phosphatase CheZ [Thiomicrorhabdus lithotrophica]
MTFSTKITLDIAQDLVQAIESSDSIKTAEIIDQITQIRESELYQQVSTLTKNLHKTLDELDDTTLLMQTKHDIPDATERLEYVIQTTEEASGKTLDQAEQALQCVDKVKDLMDSELTESIQQSLDIELNKISEKLTEIMLAQSFQDLTGQVLNRVIFIISSLEQSLIQLIENSGHDYHSIPARAESDENKKASEMKGVGPNVTQKSKQDIVESQDDIDDLLSDLGI